MIVVTGAGGFVGDRLCARLSAAGHDVLAVTHGPKFVAVPGRIALDLRNASDCERLVAHCQGASALVHLAGSISIELAATRDGDARPRATAAQFARTYEANLVMTARVLEIAHAAGTPHVLFASSQTVYGLPAAPVVTEESPLVPLEHYAASKIAAEAAVALWARGTGRMATVLRFPGVWGETRRSGLIHSLCMSALRTGRVRVGAEFPLPIDVLHRDDVAAAFEAALSRATPGFRVYNVATGEPCSLPLLGQEIAELVPGCHVETFGVRQPEIALDASRAAAELGWRAASRRERLAKFVAEMRQVGAGA